MPEPNNGNKNLTSKTKKYQEHVACSWAYHIVSRVPGIKFKPRLYVGKDAPNKFLKELRKDYYEQFKPRIDDDKEMIFDEEAQIKFAAATKCEMCSNPFEEGHKVRDHCHLSGKYRNALCTNCNLQLHIKKDRYKLPIVMHNLRGYDSHLIMQGVEKKYGSIRVIPNNMERYLSFSIGPLKFIDSAQFLNDKLENLATPLTSNQFYETKKHISLFGTELDPTITNFCKERGKKRKQNSNQNKKFIKRAKNIYIEEECDASDTSSEESDYSDMEVDKFIDDEEGVGESHSFYHDISMDKCREEKK